MEMLDLIQLVDDTSKRNVYYTVTLLELPRLQAFVEDGEDYVVKSLPIEEVGFISAEDTIQFLSDHELFGWQVKSWDFSKEWLRIGELRIVLYKMEENK